MHDTETPKESPELIQAMADAYKLIYQKEQAEMVVNEIQQRLYAKNQEIVTLAKDQNTEGA